MKTFFDGNSSLVNGDIVQVHVLREGAPDERVLLLLIADPKEKTVLVRLKLGNTDAQISSLPEPFSDLKEIPSIANKAANRLLGPLLASSIPYALGRVARAEIRLEAAQRNLDGEKNRLAIFERLHASNPAET